MAAPLLEKLMMPGITLHYVLRKRCIEAYTLETVKEGGTQVVNLGAGFDTLAYRLSRHHPSVNFIETDHPATHKVKKQAIAGSGDDAPGSPRFLPIDFTTQTLEEGLSKFPGFFPDRPTLFIIEGVLMYLNEDNVIQLFESLKRITKGGLRVIFTFAEPHSRSKILLRTAPALLSEIQRGSAFLGEGAGDGG